MEEIKREYPCSSVDLLTVSATIGEHAIEHKPFLITKRPSWADPFFSKFSDRVDLAFKEHLGIDNAKEMRKATGVVKALRVSATAMLSEFKVQIKQDFKKDIKVRDEILNTLGFTALQGSISRATYNELVQLLFQFKKNMSDELKVKITDNKISETAINDIIAQAQVLKDSGITQETLKTGRPELTQESLKEMNEIYEQTISICQIASSFFKNNKPVRNQFSFTKVLKTISSSHNSHDVPSATTDIPTP